jgi:hypothetical protein
VRGLGRDVDHGERHHQLLGRDPLHRRAAVRIVERRIDMRPGVLQHVPPPDVRAVLAQRIAPFDRDAGRAEEGRERGRQRVRQVDHRGEIALCLRGSCEKGRGRNCKKSAP